MDSKHGLLIVNNYIGGSLFPGLVILGRGFKTKCFAPRKNYHDTSSRVAIRFRFYISAKSFLANKDTASSVNCVPKIFLITKNNTQTAVINCL